MDKDLLPLKGSLRVDRHFAGWQLGGNLAWRFRLRRIRGLAGAARVGNPVSLLGLRFAEGSDDARH
jgi:hypothetical protein